VGVPRCAPQPGVVILEVVKNRISQCPGPDGVCCDELWVGQVANLSYVFSGPSRTFYTVALKVAVVRGAFDGSWNVWYDVLPH